jgi:biotin/methionine sulfoxide reductase
LKTTHPTASSHWGIFAPVVEDGEVVAVQPFDQDPDPSPLLDNIPGSIRHRARVTQPMVRAGWLEHGPGPSSGRGKEPFVPVSWETAIDLLSNELKRVLDEKGPEAIYGGSYGWASAGRFHHAQSQIHRFLNGLGGYVASVDNYSFAAGNVILNRVAGSSESLIFNVTSWPVIVEHSDLVVVFGGIPLKNATVNAGGVSRHHVRGYLRDAAANGVEFVHFSPLRDDLTEDVAATWHPLIPGSDVAVMLALAYVLIDEGLVDRAALARLTVGFEQFEGYVCGDEDGVPKSPEWAEALSEIPARTIRELARKMASSRTLINVSWSLQRTDHGEQAPWIGLTLAAMLGQIGLPGGGFAHGYGSISTIGEPSLPIGLPVFPMGNNGVDAFIPVARITDMLLHPGEPFDYDGKALTYPEIEIVYWAGGNPFHHQQNLRRFRQALERPSTIVVHEPYWTGMARHADIVLPSTVTLERDDIGATARDTRLTAMRKAVEPYAESRTDYTIFSDLAAKLGTADRFTEGRTEAEWLRHIYDRWQEKATQVGIAVPDFDQFWEEGSFELDPPEQSFVMLQDFQADPEQSPLRTPSGKIEIFSETIDGFGYDDCPGHPAWMEPAEWLHSPETDRFPLHLIANNPRTRLHSQLDIGGESQRSKVQGREPVRLHPDDAIARGISDGDVVRIFNDRGSCLAGVVISNDIRPSVIQLSTGAWFDPIDPAADDVFCVHGNPNVLTRDVGTSKLAQGCTGQHALVQIERWNDPLPPIRAYDPPMTKL